MIAGRQLKATGCATDVFLLRLEEAVEIWQERWNSSEKDEWTCVLIPDVRRRYRVPIKVDHFVSQILREHGDLRGLSSMYVQGW